MRKPVSKSIDFEEYFNEQLKDPGFKKEYLAAGSKIRVGYQISQMRKQKKMSQSALNRIGIKQTSMARLEKGEQPLSMRVLNKIADIFEKDLHIEFR